MRLSRLFLFLAVCELHSVARMEPLFFDNWQGLGRTAVLALCAYVALIVLIRMSGKRSLSKMNAFDLVVTIALGSTLATITLSKDVALAEGVLALALLLGLQYVINWLAARSSRVRGIIKSEPRLLFHSGEFLERSLLMERVSREEVLQAVRSQGVGSLDKVAAVVLETDGTFSVLTAAEQGPGDLLGNVR